MLASTMLARANTKVTTCSVSNGKHWAIRATRRRNPDETQMIKRVTPTSKAQKTKQMPTSNSKVIRAGLAMGADQR